MQAHYNKVISEGAYSVRRLSFCALVAIMLRVLTLAPDLYAQTAPVITSQESLCQATGKVIVKGNPTFFTFLTGSNIPQYGPFRGADLPGDSVVFDLLPKGNYTVTQINPNNNQEKMYPVTVTGNYEQNWTFTATPTFGACSGGTATVSIGNITITGATPAQQRPDYFFRISAKNGSLPADGNPPPPFSTPLNGSFSIPNPAGLGGTYEIQGRDVCGNYKTIKVNVPSAPPGPSVSSAFVKFTNCDGDADYDITASGGTGPYVFKVKSGPDQVNATITHASKAGFTLKAGGTYVITVTDQCGGSKDITVKPKTYVAPTFTYGTSNGTCSPTGGTGSLRIVTTADGIGPFTIKITSTGTGCGVNITKVTTKTDTTFANLPRPCTYTVTVTDGCTKSSTQTVKLIAPGADMMGCSKSIQCPSGSSEKYRLSLSVTVKPPYNPTPNYTYVVRDSLTKSVVSTSTQAGASYTTTELPEGKYYIDITDACGATCRDSVLIPKYTNPTVSVDVSNKCFGTGQANVIGINNRGVFGGNTYTYKIIAPSASRVGDGPEADSPARTGQFSSLVSGGSYTFSFSDGCKTVTTQVTIPTYQQPTWEAGFGAICPPNTKADIKIMNLQPAGEVVGPYTWRIISTDSPLYASTAPYNGKLPYPNSLGQTDSTFAGLPAKDVNGSVATYNIQGVDGCKNSYLGSGKIGTLPKPSLVLDNNKVCPDGTGSIKARPGTPVVGATYVYFRDGVKIAQSKTLFTTLSPALPGTYKIKVYPIFETDTTCSGEATAVVVSSGIIKLTKDSLTCAKPTVDLTKLAKESSVGTITFYTDRDLTQLVATPTAVNMPGIYYVKLIPAGLPNCIVKDSLTIKDVCCVKPTRLVTVTNPSCTAVGNLTLTSTNGNKYGISKGNTYLGPDYATASAVPGMLPAIIKANISNLVDSSFTIRMFNGKNDCFKDTTVTVKAAPVLNQ